MRLASLEGHPGLKRLGERLHSRRIPVVRQLHATECGAACLAMVLAYHGKHVRLEEVREAVGVGRDGSSALALLQAARGFGLSGRGLKADLDGLRALGPGAILHWEFSHFVVLESVEDDAVNIVDPALGRRRMSMSMVGRAFTGVALTLEPAPTFAKAPKGANHMWLFVKAFLRKNPILKRIIVLSLFVEVFALAAPVLTGGILDQVLPRADRQLLVVMLAGAGGMILFKVATVLLRSHLFLYLRTELDLRMTLGFLEHLVRLPFAFFQVRSAGDLMMRLNSNSTLREVLSSTALSTILDGLLVVVYLGVLLWASVGFAALVVAFAIVQLGVYVIAQRRQRELIAEGLSREARMQSYEVEMFTGLESIKALGCEDRAVAHWTDLYVDVLNTSLARGRISASFDSISAGIAFAEPILVLTAGAWLVLSGKLSLGTMMGLTSLANGFLGPLANLCATAMQLQTVRVHVDRLNDVLDAKPEQELGERPAAPKLKGRITLRNVSFRYASQSPPVVRGVSLDILPGQFVAIVGTSGAGKTTLAGLLLGLHCPSEGKVLYDGHDLWQLDLRSVRRQIGVVTQAHELFGASIRDNIAFSDPDASLEAVQSAARLAQIHDDITAMPLGYQTPLVDRGASLSGGQRQRLALARALVRQPAVLLLDEATSSLDGATERRVQEALAGLLCTRIVIAHRPSTVVRADVILVMHEGEIAETGTHAELLARGGLYAGLVAAQMTRRAA